MFQLYYDTRSEALAETLARLLVDSAGHNPLVPRTVLVPQLGLERWLTRTLAERHGIAANIEFITPAQFAWRLLRAWRDNLPERSPFDRELLQWHLFQLLPQVAARDAELAAMLPPDAAPLRRLQLAARFAHLFERYQAYRPEVLARWAAGKDVDDAQSLLWQQLVRDAGEAPRSRLMDDYCRHFGAEGAAAPPALPDPVFAYGCVNVSPQVLTVLQVVARHTQLHFMMPTPCGAYWGDAPRRHEVEQYLDELDHFMGGAEPNRLLVSLGGVGREFVARVFDDEAVQMPDVDEPEKTQARDHLLARVQADVAHYTQPQAPTRRQDEPNVDDDSIQVQVCHSSLREVQVLHDHLLDRLAREPDLEPRDIVVMMPNVSDYAPAVEAVFGAVPPSDSRYLPWTIADRPAAELHPLSALATRLLALPATRLTLDFVLEALEVPAVWARADLQVGDVEVLAERARAAGIRWGENAADREAEGLPAFDEFSWSFGRRRLLLGYMLGDDADEALVAGIAPEADIEGATARGFGALTRLQRQLHTLRRAMQTPRTARAWQELFSGHLERMLEVADDDRAGQRALADVRQAFESFAVDAESAGMEEPLDWTCLRELVGANLAASRPGQRYMDGGVSVCSMVPLRDVPFRVVCVLGLDARAFPRRDDADVLSLIRADAEQGRRLLGDRSVRDDDRYLFLQTLMAARSQLYLSYTGIDLASGRVREPSVVLEEFIEHVSRGYFCAPGADADAPDGRDRLVTQQPMQPFSPRLFEKADQDKARSRVFTYRHEWQAAARRGKHATDPAPFVAVPLDETQAHPERELAELKRFFAAPQRYFLKQRAGLVMPDIEQAGAREPLVLAGLDRWRLEQRMLPGLLAGRADTALAERMHAEALLPPLALGARAWDDAAAAMAPPVAAWRQWAGDAELPGERVPIELQLGAAGTLRGSVEGVCAAGFAGWVGNNNGNPGRWLNWWLDALACRAQHEEVSAYRAFGLNNDNNKPALPVTAAMPEPERARQLLADLMAWMRAGLRQPLVLPPKSGLQLGRALVQGPSARSKEKDPEKNALNAALAVWNHREWPESDDPWLQLTLRGHEPFGDWQACLAEARGIHVPLWCALLDKELPDAA